MNELRKRADRYYGEGDFHGVAEIFKEMIQADPRCIEYSPLLANLFAENGRVDEAKKICEYWAGAIFPNPDAVLHLLAMYILDSDYKGAYEVLSSHKGVLKESDDYYKLRYSCLATFLNNIIGKEVELLPTSEAWRSTVEKGIEEWRKRREIWKECLNEETLIHLLEKSIRATFPLNPVPLWGQEVEFEIEFLSIEVKPRILKPLAEISLGRDLLISEKKFSDAKDKFLNAREHLQTLIEAGSYPLEILKSRFLEKGLRESEVLYEYACALSEWSRRNMEGAAVHFRKGRKLVNLWALPFDGELSHKEEVFWIQMRITNLPRCSTLKELRSQLVDLVRDSEATCDSVWLYRSWFRVLIELLSPGFSIRVEDIMRELVAAFEAKADLVTPGIPMDERLFKPIEEFMINAKQLDGVNYPSSVPEQQQKRLIEVLSHLIAMLVSEDLFSATLWKVQERDERVERALLDLKKVLIEKVEKVEKKKKKREEPAGTTKYSFETRYIIKISDYPRLDYSRKGLKGLMTIFFRGRKKEPYEIHLADRTLWVLLILLKKLMGDVEKNEPESQAGLVNYDCFRRNVEGWSVTKDRAIYLVLHRFRKQLEQKGLQVLMPVAGVGWRFTVHSKKIDIVGDNLQSIMKKITF